ncbi:MAG: hypothetical protein KDA86_21445 [Planctomycetaceae bacterium]|nr:hypothetical protein [Planctomycetaceae bacterium]
MSCLIPVVAGCGSQQPQAELAPAAGVVKINGEPAANILVQFLPQVAEEAPGPTSTGVTSEDGTFEMTTVDGKDGAVVGWCKVVLVDMDEERPAQGVPLTRPPRLPANYSVLSPRTMEVEVKPASEPFIIDVRS